MVGYHDEFGPAVHPAPVGLRLQQQPDRSPYGARQMRDHGIDANHQISLPSPVPRCPRCHREHRPGWPREIPARNPVADVSIGAPDDAQPVRPPLAARIARCPNRPPGSTVRSAAPRPAGTARGPADALALTDTVAATSVAEPQRMREFHDFQVARRRGTGAATRKGTSRSTPGSDVNSGSNSACASSVIEARAGAAPGCSGRIAGYAQPMITAHQNVQPIERSPVPDERR